MPLLAQSAGLQDLPFRAIQILRHVNVPGVVHKLEVQLQAVVRPRAELEEARLLVEREVGHVHLAAALVDGRWNPLEYARVHHRYQLVVLLSLVLLVGAERIT